jgi:uncharacterized protein (TIGR02246 family)
VNELERLTAIEEIRRLIATYAIAYDDKDWDTFAELWTDDAAFTVEGQGAWEGKQALLEFLTNCLPADYDGKHMNSPSLIEVGPDGQSATARTDVVWITQAFENQIVARYNDQLVRVDGRWLFRRRDETPVEFRAGPPPMSDAAVGASAATMRKEEA